MSDDFRGAEHVYLPEGRRDRQANKQTMTKQSNNTKEMTIKENKILLCSNITAKRNTDTTDSIRSGIKH